ncbi:hypothetical protein M3Y98_01183100 [Aphelenchoides besseyi]|nr:hypothetical protein M3Y98_01183100 [Aphelenchoides besseyi]KAI6211096.1 hypothetical protein M3Y96_00397000 [Aphelenchoides besseyi]
MTKTLREALLSFEILPMEIPRPKCNGMTFVPTVGRRGFYKSIRNEGHKYGVAIKPSGPRRPTLPTADFWTPPTEFPSTDSYGSESSDDQSVASTLPPTPPPRVDANANVISSTNAKFHQPMNFSYESIPEEPEVPEPDYDDNVPSPVKNKKSLPPPPPPLPNFLLKRTIRL